jgi:hypothetical protein
LDQLKFAFGRDPVCGFNPFHGSPDFAAFPVLALLTGIIRISVQFSEGKELFLAIMRFRWERAINRCYSGDCLYAGDFGP